jgi:polysaccharide biosynthesis protein PslG
LLVAFAITGCVPAARAQADDATVFGVNANRVFNDGLPEAFVDAQLGAIAASGITEVRTDAMWAFVEPWAAGNGAFGPLYGETDRRMLAIARHGLHWRPVLDYTPGWQQTVPGDDHSAPRDPGAFAQFAAIFAARYGRAGEFWREHPDLRYLPVEAYEIWNEENTARFWRPSPEPDRYADLYLQARAAIKAIDPAASVAVGGLGHGAELFLGAMFAARPELTGQVDAVALHPYEPTVRGVVHDIARASAALHALTRRAIPVEVTEVGWESAPGSRDVLSVSEANRADDMTGLVLAIAKLRQPGAVTALLPYTWWTPRRNPADGEDWYGLAADDGSLTPAGAAYVDAIHVVRDGRRPIAQRGPALYRAHRGPRRGRYARGP